jgi:excisionase family DNA binding protein
MNYMTPKEASVLWGISERMVRMYCAEGRIPSAKQEGDTWCIPKGTHKPKRKPKTTEPKVNLSPLVKRIIYQRTKNNHYGIYEYLQVNLAYSSNRMASNRLTRNEVEEVYRTNKISTSFEPVKIDDVIETINHFSAVRYMIDNVGSPLSQAFVKKIHFLLTYGTYADRKEKIQSGEYRTSTSAMGIPYREINDSLAELIKNYEKQPANLERILEFHAHFELIHPFDDYNCRVGRIIMMKECLRHGVEPFIIDDKHRGEYNRGIKMWESNHTILTAVAEHAQLRFRTKTEICDMLEYSRPMTGRGAR